MSTLGAPFAQLSAPWPSLGGFLMVGRSNLRVFALSRMGEIKWREREWNPVKDASLCDGGVSDTLAHCRLLKFLRIPLMRSLHLLISFDLTDGFTSYDLQVKNLTEPLHFDGLFTEFDHLEAPHELFGVSCVPGHSFRRERCTLGAPVGKL